MMRIKLLLLLLFLATVPAFAKTVLSITLTPPAAGFYIQSSTNTGTVQLGFICTYTDLTTDTTCASASTPGVTWFSDNPGVATVNSSGLVTATGSPAWSSSTSYTQGQIVSYSGTVYEACKSNTNITPTSSSGTCGYGATWGPSTTLGVEIGAYNGSGSSAVVGVNAIYIAPAITCMNVRPENNPTVTETVGSTVIFGAEDCTTGNNTNGPSVGIYGKWTSATPAVATVNTRGEVTGVAAGTASISVTVGGQTSSKTITVINPAATNHVYYVRQNGGTRYSAAVTAGQCNGTTDADYPGSGVNQNCAFSNPMYCFTDESSSSVYTGVIVGPGDKCKIHNATSAAGYPVFQKSAGTKWVTNGNGTINLPTAGVPGNPIQIIGMDATPAVMTSLGGPVFGLQNAQYVDFQNVKLLSGIDCNSNLGGAGNFACPSGTSQFYALLVDGSTSALTIENSIIWGYVSAVGGNPGPGLNFNGLDAEFSNLTGINFSNPYGYSGDATDGLILQNSTIANSGFTYELPKSLVGGSVSRDGAGNLNVTFPSGAVVNYIVGTNLVLSGMAPSDLNGTFPVSSITFNQQTVNITGGSVVDSGNGYGNVGIAQYTTSATPAFGVGAFVSCTGITPSYLNGTYEVFAVGTNSFQIEASTQSRAGWTTSATVSSGGSCSTANSLTATAAGASESASVMGYASHVHPGHRATDQQDGGYSNGDGVGVDTNGTIGTYKSIGNTFHRNTQDGWDMIHSIMDTSIVQNTFSEGNEGAPWKVGNANYTLVQDNIGIANCAVNLSVDPNYPPEYNQYLATMCRANDVDPTNTVMWGTTIKVNNTWEGTHNTFIDDICNSLGGCNVLPFPAYVVQNNLYIGFTDSNNPSWNTSLPAVYYGEYGANQNGGPTASWTWSNNLAYNMRNPPSGGSGNNWNLTPFNGLVVHNIPNISALATESNAIYTAGDLNLTSTSAAINFGVSNAYTPSTDYNGNAQTSPPTIGAVVYGPVVIGGAVVIGGGTLIQ